MLRLYINACVTKPCTREANAPTEHRLMSERLREILPTNCVSSRTQYHTETVQLFYSRTENSPEMLRVNTLLEVLNKHFIKVDEIDISPDESFRTTTEAIEARLPLWQDAARQTGETVETHT